MSETTFAIGRGTNISHWLSQSRRRGQERRAWFTEADVRRIAGWGLDHIRLPVDEEQCDAEGLALLDQALDWCEAAGLRVIVDLHILRSHYFNQETEPELFTNPRAAAAFIELWLELQHRLRGRPLALVAYELLNEPVARDPQRWNDVARAVFGALREVEPEREIFLGSNWFNSVRTFDALWIPDDPHCWLTFHFYSPMLITHYRAAWWRQGGRYAGPIQYPGVPALDPLPAGLESENVPYDRAAMVRDLAQPLAARARTGRPLYCGEFGCYEQTPTAVRQAWYRDILSVLAEHQIAWANWDYKGGFGLLNKDGVETDIARLIRASPSR